MDRPLEISFHDLSPSAAIEAQIRRHVERLDRRFSHLIGCRVSVEAPHRQHRTGNVVEVHITLSLPGNDLAVSPEPHHAKDRYAEADLELAINEAFANAERQLMARKAQRRQDTSAPDASALRGQVALIQPGDDHGFILTSTGGQLYFHRDSVTDGDFDRLREGDVVHYVEEEGDAGPVAAKVRVGGRTA